ncbi:MAG: endopeptidase La [Deltaproteobacteria bacterium]|nr:endopeptidase La [Deltaproteobacteria bacterium]
MIAHEHNTAIYPLMPLRDIVIFPHVVAPLIVGRGRSIKALEYAMANRLEIFLTTQLDTSVNSPSPKDVHKIGTIAAVLQLLRLPDGTIKALLEGRRRGCIDSFVDNNDFFMAQVEEFSVEAVDDSQIVAYQRNLLASFKRYVSGNKSMSNDVAASVSKITHPAKFIDVLASHLPVKTAEKQTILETVNLVARYDLVLEMLNRETEIISLEGAIHAKVKKKLAKNQRDYYLNEQMRVIKEEMGNGRDEQGAELDELVERLKNKKLSKEANEKVEHELKKLRMMPPSSAEATVVHNYIDCILSLPWYHKTRKKLDINKAEEIMDEDHFGLRNPKERILEYLAVQAQVKKISGPILCLVGPPGVGKTSLCKSVARAMGRKFTRLSLGGVRDEAEIRGHRRTYIGAMPGRIIRSLQKVKVNNPVFCLDEVDKMSADFRGDPASALLEVLDPEQNAAFSDHYLDLDYDLSDVFFITTANSLYNIPVPLQDRMEIITIEGYTEEDKSAIAKGFLVPKQMKTNGFKAGEVIFNGDSIMEIIRRYTREAGVRNLERSIASMYRKIARHRLQNNKTTRYRITRRGVAKYLGTPKYRFGMAEDKDATGLVNGLAWTAVGGEILQIETVLLPGKGKLLITGKLGDVMQESAQAALSYVRSRTSRLGIADDFYEKVDIHVHVPEGAIPKDGPSAGITMTTSIVSALLKLPVRRDLAMTGEVTLRGRVLPIGGLTEKLLAAKRANMTCVLVPKENEKNVKDVPDNILNSLRIEFVDHVDEALEKAIIVKDNDSLFKECESELFCPDIMVHNAPLAAAGSAAH